MNFQCLAMEHNRLHRVEDWPDSPLKEAVLAGIRSKIASLMRNVRDDLTQPICEVCLSHTSGLIKLRPEQLRMGSVSRPLAA